MKKFYVSFTLAVDEEGNLLSSCLDDHQEDVLDLVTAIMYDIDDIRVENLTVKERT